ncbi:hypothetical protein, partial [Burkholderia stagnalis]|uniref:hypothetical protein n=1 Tax=Burkholderia stagnalis TaxID=1503054 RepID=UPI001C8945B3
ESLFHCRSSLERTLHRHRTKRGEQVRWAVLRGRGVVRWAQITPAGEQEIARRLGVAVGESDNE